jgi:hypothetical protein
MRRRRRRRMKGYKATSLRRLDAAKHDHSI